MENKIKAILWDVHGVLYGGPFAPIYTSFSNRLGIPENAGEEIIGGNISALMVGTFTVKDLDRILLEKFNKIANTKQLFVESMREHITMYPEILEIVDTLRSQAKQVVFSNMGDMRDFFDQETGIYDHFDDLMLSYKLGLAKPSQEFFALACSRLGLLPSEMLLIDDSAVNIEAAKAFGMQGILHKKATADELKVQLRSAGFEI